jgi:hypothetical protein
VRCPLFPAGQNTYGINKYAEVVVKDAVDSVLSSWQRAPVTGIYADVNTSLQLLAGPKTTQMRSEIDVCGLGQKHPCAPGEQPSAAFYKHAPAYVVSLSTNAFPESKFHWHWRVTGSGSIYKASGTGFRIYLNRTKNAGFANMYQWRVDYLAYDGMCSVCRADVACVRRTHVVVALHLRRLVHGLRRVGVVAIQRLHEAVWWRITVQVQGDPAGKTQGRPGMPWSKPNKGVQYKTLPPATGPSSG